jgi:Zn finger protein HypA/HybF involved in hydrogenase expression
MPLEERFVACPGCGSTAVRLVAGAELRLAEMEVE